MKEQKRSKSRILALAGLLFGLHEGALAAPCDASVPIKGCIGRANLEGKFVVLRSSTSRCSVIEWSLDSVRKTTTVIDGQERLELLTTKPRDLQVESCTEVKDLRSNTSSQMTTPAPGPAPAPLPAGAIVLPQHANETAPAAIVVRPSAANYYPAESVAAGERGRIVLWLCWNANGRVVRSEVEKSSGYPRLDEAAVKMGRNFRFRPAMMGSKPLEDCAAQPVSFTMN